ncbi:MAG: AMP-binding protein, partial [bacterium]|nr:AMP-binding protein [bacterium]
MTNRKFIPQTLETTAVEKPGTEALVYKNQRFTYGELEKETTKIARTIIKKGLKTGEIAAVDMPDPITAITAAIGIIKAGGTNLTLDNVNPSAYKKELINRAGVKYLLDGTGGNTWTKRPGKQELNIITPAQWQNEETTKIEPAAPLQEENIHTVIYRTNSTGKPEGIIHTHRHQQDRVDFALQKLKIDFSRTLYLFPGNQAVEFLMWQANQAPGGTAVFIDQREQDQLNTVEKNVREKGIKSIFCTIEFLEQIVAENAYKRILPPNLANIVTVGEKEIETGTLKKYLKEQNIRWHNFFGYPEMEMITTVTTTATDSGNRRNHTGKPAPGTNAYVLTVGKEPAAKGVTGELYMKGKGVMDGYLQNEELNARHYIDDPFTPGTKLYKTGYRALWLEGWKLALRERDDNRLKINAAVIAPEEIEQHLLKHETVEECAVVQGNNNPHITAYVVLKDETYTHTLE